MHTRRHAAEVVGTALMLAALAGASAPGASRESVESDALPLTLESIRETRSTNFSPDADSPSGECGLEFRYRVDLPEGVRVALIRQPAKVTATDSEGTDLANIAPDIFDRVQFLVYDDGFGDRATLRLVLGCAARKAASVDIRLKAEAVTFLGTESFDVKRSEQWMPLEHPSFAGMTASCRVVEEETSVRLVVRPAAARDWIIGVYPASPEAEPAGYSVSWDDESATFDIDPRPEPGQEVRVFVKAGLKVVPIEIDEKARSLP